MIRFKFISKKNSTDMQCMDYKNSVVKFLLKLHGLLCDYVCISSPG